MKRVLCFLLATALLFSFSACRSVKVGSDLQPTSGLETNETDPTSQTETMSNGGLDASPTTKATKATKKTKATKSTKATKATSAVSATNAPVCEPTEAPVTETIVIPTVAPTEIPTVQTTAAPTTKATKATKATKVTKATKATSAQTVATEPEGTKHIHSYTAKIVEATCLLDGYTEHICACGDRYVDTYTKKTNDHEFASTMIQKSNGGAYPTIQCKKCKLEVFNHGGCGAKGDVFSSPVKFYITYDGVTEYPGDQEDKYHLVIYGEGAMRSYEGPNAELPTWYDDLELHTTRITIEEGVTEIGSYSFYAPDSRHEITIEMADSVKVIRENSIYLKKTKELILGNGVERIEGDIFRDNVTRIYLPRSLKYIETFARKNSAGKDVVYYYQGTKAEFLSMKIYHVGKGKITMQQRLESFYSSGGTRFCTVYLNCAKLLDKHDYFDMYAVFGK